MSLILYLILSLVPIFKNNCIWNYMINIFLQLVIIFVCIVLIMRAYNKAETKERLA